MALKLRVISDHYKALGKRSSRLFGVTGGKIGRAQDNDWILPDPDRYVSSHHCKVDFRAGRWMLEDTSTNGVFINGSDTPASVAGAYTLQDGDRLRLGDYEVLVSIDERNDFGADDSGQIPAPPRVRNKSNVKHHPRSTDGDLGEEIRSALIDSVVASISNRDISPGCGVRIGGILHSVSNEALPAKALSASASRTLGLSNRFTISCINSTVS